MCENQDSIRHCLKSGRESMIGRYVLPSNDLCARLWWEMCTLLVQEVDDVSPQVTM